MNYILHYVGNMTLWVLLGFGVLYGVARARTGGPVRGAALWKTLLAAVLIGVCSQTILPRMDIGILSNKPHIAIHRSLGTVNLVPLRTIWKEAVLGNPVVGPEDRWAVMAVNLAGNLLLFLPVGFLLPLASEKYRGLKDTILFTLAVSGIIELIQFLIGRSADIDDVILHIVGAIAGYLLGRLLGRGRKAAP